MRTKTAVTAGLAIALGATWSVKASAQLQPPPPMQPLPAWGAPPPPMQQPPPGWGPPPQSATVQQLNASDNASSFRRFELVYLNAEVGGAYVNLNQNNSLNPGGQGGVAFGLGAGLRFLTFTLGIRGRVAPLSAFTLIEANLEAGLHLPLGAWDPYLNVHGGYAHAAMNSEPALTIGTVSFGSVTPASPSGGDFGASLGADYYFSALFSLGLDATLDGLFVSTSDTFVSGAGSTTILVAHGQSSTGVAFLGTVHAGLHFDL